MADLRTRPEASPAADSPATESPSPESPSPESPSPESPTTASPWTASPTTATAVTQPRRRGPGGAIAARPWLVLLGFLLLLGALVPLASIAEDRMQSVVFAAKEDAHEADRLLSEDFPGGPPHMVVLATVSDGGLDDDGVEADATRLLDRLEAEPGVASADSYWSVGDPRLRSEDGRTGLFLVRLRGEEERRIETADRLLTSLPQAQGQLELAITGDAAVSAALDTQMEADLVRAELITAPLALIVLVLVFGSLVAAGLPLLVAVGTVTATLAVLTLVTFLVPVSSFSLNLTTAIGIGLAVDYSLFVITRFREQLRFGDTPQEAVQVTVRTAGRTVWFSALTVALGFLAPVVFPSMRSLAYAGIVAALMAAAVATTALPAVLVLLGSWISRLDPLRRQIGKHRDTDRGFWSRLAAGVMHRPGWTTIGVVALLLLFALPFGRANFGVQDDRVLPVGSAVHEAGQLLREQFPQASESPVTVVLPDLSAAAGEGAAGRLGSYAAALSFIDDVDRVETTTGTYADGRQVEGPTEASARFASADGTWLQVTAGSEPFSAAGRQVVEEVRDTPAPAEAYVGGATAGLSDTRAEIVDRLPWALLIIGSSTFVLLFLFTGGLLIPLKAVVLNLLSLTATFGAMVFVFQDGNLRWLVGDFTVTGYLDIGIPVLIFFVAFGLSMDYEVFMLSRIAEAYQASGDNTEAVARGLQRTGGLVTAAAALLAVVLGAMATSGVSSLKLLGVGLALAIVLDATLVRALLVPAIMRLAGDANWWAPRPLRRLHRWAALSD